MTQSPPQETVPLQDARLILPSLGKFDAGEGNSGGSEALAPSVHSSQKLGLRGSTYNTLN